jgi:SAM-dependent methyltransferase
MAQLLRSLIAGRYSSVSVNEFYQDFDRLVKEIVSCTSLPIAEVRHRVWMEALELGWNVSRDMESFHANPHLYDDHMSELYRQGDGFIFETMVVSAKPSRQKWTHQALDRIRLYADRQKMPLSTLRVLMMGDGSGSDSLLFVENGIPVDYFDIPGSKTFEFAVRRFRRHDVLDSKVRVITEHEDCYRRQLYDVVLSFEVLEHLPDPESAVREISRRLKEGGIALMTESFAAVDSSLPTHLKSNLRYCGRLPVMCYQSGLLMTWNSTRPRNKPLEFMKVPPSHLPSKIDLFRNKLLLSFFFGGYLTRAKLWTKNVLTKYAITRA